MCICDLCVVLILTGKTPNNTKGNKVILTIEALTQSQRETEFKELHLILIEEVEKVVRKLFP